jgi:hypothetical protein
MSTSSPNKLIPHAKPRRGNTTRICRLAGRKGSGSGCQPPPKRKPLDSTFSSSKTKRARREPRGRECASAVVGMEQARSRSVVPDGPLTYPTGRSRRVHARSTNARAVNAALCRGRTRPHPRFRRRIQAPRSITEERSRVCAGLQIIAHLPRQCRAGWRG